jgi:branched-chain amino acid aminotransferase
VQSAAAAVLEANALREARLRITVTGGVQPLGSERRTTTPTIIVAASTLRAAPHTVSVVVVPWSRNERGATAGLKTVSYAENVRALAYAQTRGAGEAVFANTRDQLCEATGSNIFVVDEDVVRTPPASSGCLLGVTRALVLELCVELGLAHEEVTMPVEVLARAGEVFLTSTTREVQAVTQIDGRALPHSGGRVTAGLAEAFSSLVARDPDP